MRSMARQQPRGLLMLAWGAGTLRFKTPAAWVDQLLTCSQLQLERAVQADLQQQQQQQGQQRQLAREGAQEGSGAAALGGGSSSAAGAGGSGAPAAAEAGDAATTAAAASSSSASGQAALDEADDLPSTSQPSWSRGAASRHIRAVEASAIAVSAARLRARPAPDWAELFAQLAARQLPAMSPRQLANCLLAGARAGLVPSPAFVGAAQEAGGRLLGQLGPGDVAMLLLAAARMQRASPPGRRLWKEEWLEALLLQCQQVGFPWRGGRGGGWRAGDE
jgi:hypothetical protein